MNNQNLSPRAFLVWARKQTFRLIAPVNFSSIFLGAATKYNFTGRAFCTWFKFPLPRRQFPLAFTEALTLEKQFPRHTGSHKVPPACFAPSRPSACLLSPRVASFIRHWPDLVAAVHIHTVLCAWLSYPPLCYHSPFGHLCWQLFFLMQYVAFIRPPKRPIGCIWWLLCMCERLLKTL